MEIVAENSLEMCFLSLKSNCMQGLMVKTTQQRITSYYKKIHTYKLTFLRSVYFGQPND